MILLGTAASVHAADIAGAKDHPLVSRYAGSEILKYEMKEFDLLGHSGDSLTLRLEKARTIEEFAMHVERCRDVVENAVGKNKADQFWNAVVAKLSA